MKNYLGVRYVLPLVVILFITFWLFSRVFFPTLPEYVTAKVETGTVSEIVSVSGTVEAKQSAELNFGSNSGVVTGVFVEEGQVVEKGEVIASLSEAEIVAEKMEVMSTLEKAVAEYDLLLAGKSAETIAVAESSILKERVNLSQVITEEDVKVKNAWLALLNNDLEAVIADINDEATPPTVSGTYSCEVPGEYTIEVYSSKAQSGYSYRLSGLEENSGTSVGIDQPGVLGSCGLLIQFSPEENYHNSVWTVSLPNKKSSSYTELNNTYNLALAAREKVIENAASNLVGAEKEAGLETAATRVEDLRAGLARVKESEARVAAVDAKLRNRSIIAPFSGIVTELEVSLGEIVGADPALILIAPDNFSLKARIPEIDITKLNTNQKVEATFDAKDDEVVVGEVRYVSPSATMIDGVAYFETEIVFTTPPAWLRSGLNADVDIYTESRENVSRLPKRFVESRNGQYFVWQKDGRELSSTTISVDFVGNDGFYAISGLPSGTEVVAP